LLDEFGNIIISPIQTMNSFTYILQGNTTNPNQRPQAPFSPTTIEVMRSCPLRVCFEASPGYERRIGFAARVGTAFHRVMQSFNESALPITSPDAALEEARLRFQRELQKQIAEAASHPREVGLPHDQSRVDRASEAILVEARRSYDSGVVGSPRLAPKAANHQQAVSLDNNLPLIEVEVSVTSQDGLLHGRIDRVEHRPDGIWLSDYKSALRDDLPERYERQLQMYAYLWHQTRNEWPSGAQVIYPLVGTIHEVSLDQEKCLNIATEALQLIQHLGEEHKIERLATPGDVCQVCDYRPWCRPFWQWQAKENNTSQALAGAEWGFEGTIARINLNNHHWQLQICWRTAQVQLVAPEERFPHLAKANVGMGVRVLDTPLRGLRHQPQAIVSPRSEIFLILKDDQPL